MRTILVWVLLVPTILLGQSVIPNAVRETLNLAPRCQKGSLQRYELQVETFILNDDASPKTHKRDILSYIQYCTANSPETGLEYKITIDSFIVSAHQPMDRQESPMMTVQQLDGFQISSKLTRELPVKDGCYDLGVTFSEPLHFIEIFDVSESYRYLRLIEQLRLTAGLRLSKIGDTVQIALPGPICEQVPKVVNMSRIELVPQVLELTGLTKFGSTACAIVTMRPSSSPVTIDIWNSRDIPFLGSGTLSLACVFVVALDDGDILSATITERNDSRMMGPDGTPRDSRRHKVLRLRQLN